MLNLTVVILTKDEAHHLPRALKSLRGLARRVVVVDGGSSDGTQALGRRMGAEVWEHPWRTYAAQFNWALAALGSETDWVLRLDADEVLTGELAREIAEKLPLLPARVTGAYLHRRVCFQRRPMRWGGVQPVKTLRLFRHGAGRFEGRWEHDDFCLEGETVSFENELIDDNLNDLTTWVAKKNSSASREVVDLLNLKYRFMGREAVAMPRNSGEAGFARWIKPRLQAALPGPPRVLAQYLYRYLIRLGFLDGGEGAAFHLMDGLWYRVMVIAKFKEVEARITRDKLSPEMAISIVLGLHVGGSGAAEDLARAA